MSKIGDSMIRGAEEALAFAKGEADLKAYRVHIPKKINVRRIRRKLGMSQGDFAESFGFSVRTVQEWEQGRSVPQGAAKNFLVVLDREPAAVRRALVDMAE
jgi:putative transcriptional regulator